MLPVNRLQSKQVHLGILAAITLLLRVLGASSPYYVDGPSHVHAIETGALVIQAPGYFLFNLLGLLLSQLLHISAAAALQAINIGFSVAGVAVFYLLAMRLLKDSGLAFWLALAYACSPIVWFSAEIHSTYSAMTFFAPLLLWTLEGESYLLGGCFVWALMTAFRPSDGVFVLPWMIYQARRFPLIQRLAGAILAAVVAALWWIPTVKRFGGGLLGPLRSSQSQATMLAQGILVPHATIHALANVVHTLAGTVVAWGLLTPLVFLGTALWKRNPISRSMMIYMGPGIAFFTLYFFSDATYLAYAVAPGMILAAIFLYKKSAKMQRSVLLAAITTSILFMSVARMSDRPSTLRTVLDAYVIHYAIPSIKEHKVRRLASLLGACRDGVVKGTCQ